MTHGAIRLHRTLNTYMFARKLRPHALIALHAVEEVLSEPLPGAADVAAMAVVYIFCRIVVKELAHCTKVNRHLFTAIV
jgi:hypothetical protein